jgi:hypothetical protein
MSNDNAHELFQVTPEQQAKDLEQIKVLQDHIRLAKNERRRGVTQNKYTEARVRKRLTEDDPMLTSTEAGYILGVSPRTMSKYTDNPKEIIKSFRLPHSDNPKQKMGERRIPLSELIVFMKTIAHYEVVMARLESFLPKRMWMSVGLDHNYINRINEDIYKIRASEAAKRAESKGEVLKSIEYSPWIEWVSLPTLLREGTSNIQAPVIVDLSIGIREIQTLFKHLVLETNLIRPFIVVFGEDTGLTKEMIEANCFQLHDLKKVGGIKRQIVIERSILSTWVQILAPYQS